MPTYVYACKECDDRLEVVQKMSDEPLKECPKCGGSLRRVLFPPAVVYKGSGFYTTDYKNSSSSTPAPSSSSSASSESKTESKTETKPESNKTEAKASA